MGEVSIRELRNRGGEVIERVARGERLLVTRDGHAVAELRPLGRTAATAAVLVERGLLLRSAISPHLNPLGRPKLIFLTLMLFGLHACSVP